MQIEEYDPAKITSAEELLHLIHHDSGVIGFTKRNLITLADEACARNWLTFVDGKIVDNGKTMPSYVLVYQLTLEGLAHRERKTQ